MKKINKINRQNKNLNIICVLVQFDFAEDDWDFIDSRFLVIIQENKRIWFIVHVTDVIVFRYEIP